MTHFYELILLSIGIVTLCILIATFLLFELAVQGRIRNELLQIRKNK